MKSVMLVLTVSLLRYVQVRRSLMERLIQRTKG